MSKPPYRKSGEIEKSSINLIDYAKTKLLEPGESETVKLSIDPYYMASYDCYDKNNNGAYEGEYYSFFNGNYMAIDETLKTLTKVGE